jgi:endonuclease VIII-like 1
MPEGPDIFLFALQVSQFCAGKLFTGVRVPVPSAKHPVVDIDVPFTVHSDSRGKEQRLVLCSSKTDRKAVLIFHHGLAGKWKYSNDEFNSAVRIAFARDDDEEALCWHDAIKLGSYSVQLARDSQLKDLLNPLRAISCFESAAKRGPDPLVEHGEFRRRLVEILGAPSMPAAFKSPSTLADLMLDQRYFNGVGNYMRAEVLARAGLWPFSSAESLLVGHADRVERLCRALFDTYFEIVSGRIGEYGDARRDFYLAYNCGSMQVDRRRRKCYFLAEQRQNRVPAKVLERYPSLATRSAEPMDYWTPALGRLRSLLRATVPIPLLDSDLIASAPSPSAASSAVTLSIERPAQFFDLFAAPSDAKRLRPTARLLYMCKLLRQRALLSDSAAAELKSVALMPAGVVRKQMALAAVEAYAADPEWLDLDDLADTLQKLI